MQAFPMVYKVCHLEQLAGVYQSHMTDDQYQRHFGENSSFSSGERITRLLETLSNEENEYLLTQLIYHCQEQRRGYEDILCFIDKPSTSSEKIQQETIKLLKTRVKTLESQKEKLEQTVNEISDELVKVKEEKHNYIESHSKLTLELEQSKIDYQQCFQEMENLLTVNKDNENKFESQLAALIEEFMSVLRGFGEELNIKPSPSSSLVLTTMEQYKSWISEILKHNNLQRESSNRQQHYEKKIAKIDNEEEQGQEIRSSGQTSGSFSSCLPSTTSLEDRLLDTEENKADTEIKICSTCQDLMEFDGFCEECQRCRDCQREGFCTSCRRDLLDKKWQCFLCFKAWNHAEECEDCMTCVYCAFQKKINNFSCEKCGKDF